jgi:hypothetical protein
MNATLRKRIEKAEAVLIQPKPRLSRSLLVGRPSAEATAQEWADYERELAQAQQDGCKVIVLVPLRPVTRVPIPERVNP